MDKSDDSSVIAEKVLLDVMRSIGFKKTLDFLLTVVLSEWHKNLTLALLFSVMRWVIRNFQGSDHICIFPLSEKTSKLIWAGGGSPRETAIARGRRMGLCFPRRKNSWRSQSSRGRYKMSARPCLSAMAKGHVSVIAVIQTSLFGGGTREQSAGTISSS